MNPDDLQMWDSLAMDAGRESNPLSSYAGPSSAQVADSSIFGGGSNPSLGMGSFLKLGSSILGAYGSLLQGSEIAGADEYNAQLALEQGQFEISDLDVAEAETLSTQKAMYAKSGVAMTGSPLDAATQTAYGYEMDKQIATYNTQSRANMYNYQGKVAKSQGEIKAGEQLLEGAATAGLALMLL